MSRPSDEIVLVPANGGGGWDEESDAVIIGRDDVSDFNEENILPQPKHVLAKIRAWLKPTEYDNEGGEFRKHLASHLPGTGDWLFATDAYRQWHSSQDQGLLWIRGIPGSGKSVFAASIINRLHQEECPVLYFFFRQIIDANHSPDAALRDWLTQLLPYSPPLQAVLKQYLDESRKLESLSSADLWRHLRQATIYIPKVYLAVDALDEIDQTKALVPFLQSLAALGGWRPSQVKVVATSRPVAHVEQPLRTAKAIHIRLEERQVDIDIAKYIKHKLSRTSIPLEMQERIRAAVPGRANGLFLYAKLAMDAFLRPGADTAQVLDQLPQDLSVMYTELLREHSKRSGVPDDIQLLILQAVTHASRPLRLLEIAEFIDVTQRTPEERDLKSAKDLVCSACGPLLEILPDKTVSVVHHSLTEFLNGSTRKSTPGSYPVLEPGPTHNRLALVCLSYLLSGLMDDIQLKSGREHVEGPGTTKCESKRLAHPFVEYAAQNWNVHARKSDIAGYDMSRVNVLTDELFSGQNMDKCKFLARRYHGFSWRRRTPLMIASKFGLVQYVKVLLDRPGTDVNKDSHEGVRRDGSPLCGAAAAGYDEVVDLLLKAGADSSAKCGNGATPLFLAASNGHLKVTEMLVDAGVSPFAEVSIMKEGRRRVDKESPLLVACRHGHMKVILEFSSRIEKLAHATQLLSSAVTEGRPMVVELALGHPLVEVDAKIGKRGDTALFAACRKLNPIIIRMLLDAGADPNLWVPELDEKNRGANTPLLALAEESCLRQRRRDDNTPELIIECFELLLAAGADVTCLDSQGNSLLHLVQDPVLARLLLDAGADPNVANEKGETVLHTCDNEDLLRVFLADAKVDLERKTEDGLTPLLRALQKSRVTIALLLLDLGASPTPIETCSKLGVFHYAVQIYSDKTAVCEQIPHLIRRLRECGGDANARDRSGITALSYLLSRDENRLSQAMGESMFCAMIDASADLEARDRQGRTVFFRMLAKPVKMQDWKWDMMISAGAKLDTVDHEGRTLFHCCPSGIVRFIAHGMDPKQTDYAGNSLWHAWVRTMAQSAHDPRAKENPSEAEELFKLGIDILQPNHAGRTPLHEMCRYSNRPHRFWNGFRSTDMMSSPETQRMQTILEWMVGQYSSHGVDQTDNDGVTALHVASTHCESAMRVLLQAGADAQKATLEGLTPLHIAARSRQPNIIAILLGWLKYQLSEEEFLAAINATDESSERTTPLQLACTSGNYASVRLLLEAGACNRDTSALWRSCLGFEEEDLRWPHEEEHHEDWMENYYYKPKPIAGSVLLKDPGRRKNTAHGKYPEERLDEILDLLAGYFPPTMQEMNKYVDAAASKNLDYTVDCLCGKRAKLFPDFEAVADIRVSLCLARRVSNRSVVFEYPGEIPSLSPRSYEEPYRKYERMMSFRDYPTAVDFLFQNGGIPADRSGRTILYDLVVGGFASILKRVATRDQMAQLEHKEFIRALVPKDREPKPRYDLHYPLLLLACKPKNPNMDVIRVLVEDLGVDINAKHWAHADQWDVKGGVVEDRTALHILAEGEHWWQSNLALPYLIDKGANVDVRDATGLSPLMTAINQIPSPHFYPFAVEVLLANGADVNAVDPRGHTPLTRAVGDMRVFQLLLQHGAKLTYFTFTTAIGGRRPDILRVMLENGADPNQRPTEEDLKAAEEATSIAPLLKPNWRVADEDTMELHHQYPLDCASHYFSGTNGQQMIQVLLAHGANPHARYRKTTIIHRIIEYGSLPLVRLFLGLPSLQLETRDSEGNTLLLKACHSPPMTPYQKDPSDDDPRHPVDILLDRGADIHARSTDGSTALHNLILKPHSAQGTPDSSVERLLRRIALAAPDFINTCNNAGETPLHRTFAARNDSIYTDRRTPLLFLTSALLSLGADPRLPDAAGNTPLHLLLCCEWRIDIDNKLTCGVADIFRTLVAAGVDVNARNNTGETPLFSFCREGSVVDDGDKSHSYYRNPKDGVLWDLFRGSGMDFNARNDKGETLLHAVATLRDRERLARFRKLMGRGLDPLVEDWTHRTALDVAAAVGARDVLGLFKRGEKGQEEEEEEGKGLRWLG